MTSILFPEEFKALKGHPGYFWHVGQQRLYSIKIGGVLRKLKIQYPNKHCPIPVPYYQLSKNGNTVYIGIDRIEKILEDPHTIPVQKSLFEDY